MTTPTTSVTCEPCTNTTTSDDVIFDLQEFYNSLADTAVDVGLRLCYAIALFIIGRIIIAIISRIIKKVMRAKKQPPKVTNFVVAIILGILKVLLWIFILGIIGLDIGGVAAVVAAVLFALAFAFSGLLLHIVSGLILLSGERVKEGDIVDHKGSGIVGTVGEISLLDTDVVTFDNKMVKVPNSDMLSSVVEIINALDTRRVDFKFGISYDADIKKAKKIIEHSFKNDKRIFKSPEWTIVCSGHGDSAVDITARAWCKKDDYWDVFFHQMERIKYYFDDHSIGIPYPQTDVHLYKEEKPVDGGGLLDLELSETMETSSSSSSSSDDKGKLKKLKTKALKKNKKKSKKGKGEEEG